MIHTDKGFGIVNKAEIDVFPLAQSLVLLWMILELATSLVALTGAKSSRKLTAKRISCQKSQFWVI